MARATGGNSIYEFGEYTIHVFTSNGTFTPDATLDEVDVVVVAGGGAGSSGYEGSGGGAGEVIRDTAHAVTPTAGHTVTIGAGGTPNSPGNPPSTDTGNGGNSVFDTITAKGGGGGGVQGRNSGNGIAGGSGGGSARTGTPGGTATANANGGTSYKNIGGQGANDGATGVNGGGGGATSPGGAGTPSSGSGTGGVGGAGLDLSADFGTGFGVSGVVAGGGGGAGNTGNAAGGSGGGGTGGNSSSDAGVTSGAANTGSGGGGCRLNAVSAGSGGSGVVVIRYITNPVDPATVTTEDPADNITSVSATGGGNVTDDGGGTVSERGIVWGESPNPTTAGNKQASGSGSGAFTDVAMTGLSPNTHYYYRAYAINEAGTAYGSDVEFDTLDAVISGDCVLNGSPVEGAVITLINSDTDAVVATTTSDAAGYYEFTELDVTATYHVVAEFIDGYDMYNAKSLPFMTPEEITPLS